jgi:hypothetical protein
VRWHSCRNHWQSKLKALQQIPGSPQLVDTWCMHVCRPVVYVSIFANAKWSAVTAVVGVAPAARAVATGRGAPCLWWVVS